MLRALPTTSSFLGTSRPFTGVVAPVPRRQLTTHIVAAYGDLPKIGGGRKWEHYELLPGGRAVRIKMHVKKGDKVQVVAGKDKGKVGVITRVLPKKGKVVVEGVNILTKNIKPKSENEPGSQKQSEFPIHHSNVMHYSETQSTRSRIGHKILDDGRKVRYLIKTGELLD